MAPSLPRILYLDDDPESCSAMAAWLDSARDLYDAATVSSAAGAAEIISGGRVDLFILAITPGEITQAELCEQIRQTNKRLPIIVYSPAERILDYRRAVRAGADLYLNKPQDFDALKLAIPHFLATGRF